MNDEELVRRLTKIETILERLEESHNRLTQNGTISCQYREPQTDIGKMVAGLTGALVVIGGILYAAYEVIKQHGK